VLGITYNGMTGTMGARNWNMQMPWIKSQTMEDYVTMTLNTKYLSFSIQLTNFMVKNIP
jgi:hypothetical protein